MVRLALCLMLLSGGAGAQSVESELMRPRYDIIALVRPKRIEKLVDLEPHIKLDLEGGQISQVGLIGSIVEMRHCLHLDGTYTIVQYHPRAKLFTVRYRAIDDVQIINPGEESTLVAPAILLKANKMLRSSVRDILQAFDY